MSKIEWKKLVGATGRLLLAFAFVFSQTAWAGQNQNVKDNTKSAQKAAARQAGEKQSSAGTAAKAQSKQAQGEESESSVAEEKSSGDGKHEGIKVHGHWTIEVRNPNGTLVSHREFENSLTAGLNGGSQGLAVVLGHQATVGGWSVFLYNSNGGCGGICVISENYPGSTAGSQSNNLTVTVTPNPSTGVSILTLTGSMSAPAAFQINGVATQFLSCPPSLSPQACFAIGIPAPNAFSLTSAYLTQSVQSGQIVAVTVVLSFS
jgi:hypothetical protein